ncbi:MAG: hypothetical protein A2W36_04605 [Chloroflexi bacterium RBG_16_58_14]|nr:MAG: hypothetical protein A2W36_04605 [Chloroflexi bacterium RBG_16_58_14]
MDKHECRQLLGSLSEFVDGSLEEDICAEIERHLAGCQDCRIVVDTLAKTIYLYRTTSQETTTPEEVRQRLFRCLEIDDFTDSAHD